MVVLLAGACSKEDVFSEKEGRVRIRVSVSEAFRNLTDVWGNPAFDEALQGNYRIRVHAFLYLHEKDSSRLAASQVVYLDDIREDAYLWLDADAGRYNVVATADLVELQGGRDDWEYNSIVPDRFLAEVKIVHTRFGGIYNAAGYTVSKGFDLRDDGEKVNVKLILKPFGTLVTYYFCGMPSDNEFLFLEMPVLVQFRARYLPADDDFFTGTVNKSSEECIGHVYEDRTYRMQSYIAPDGYPVYIRGATQRMRFNKRFTLSWGTNVFIKIDLDTSDDIELFREFPQWAGNK